MNKALIIIVLTCLMYFASCGVKEPCELNNTGEICVKNYSGKVTEVYVNDVRVFTMADNTENCLTKPVGDYTVKFINLTDENSVTVTVLQCESTSVNVSF